MCYSFWFYAFMFMFVLCLVVWFVSFVCLFSEERDKERAWSWAGRDGVESGRNRRVGKAGSKYTVWKNCFQLKNCVCVGETLKCQGTCVGVRQLGRASYLFLQFCEWVPGSSGNLTEFQSGLWTYWAILLLPPLVLRFPQFIRERVKGSKVLSGALRKLERV